MTEIIKQNSLIHPLSINYCGVYAKRLSLSQADVLRILNRKAIKYQKDFIDAAMRFKRKQCLKIINQFTKQLNLN
jgi:hypothetical protein